MEKLKEYIDKKRSIALVYQENLSGVLGISTMKEAVGVFCTFWLYTILVDEKEYGMNRYELHKKLDLLKVCTRALWQPLHLNNAHKNSQFYHISIAEKIYQKALSLPSSVGLGIDDVYKVTDIIKGS